MKTSNCMNTVVLLLSIACITASTIILYVEHNWEVATYLLLLAIFVRVNARPTE